MWRLFDCKPDPQPGAGGKVTKVWIDETAVPEGTPFWDLSGTVFDGETERTFLAVQEQAEQRFDVLVKQMAAAEGVTEQLKAADQML